MRLHRQIKSALTPGFGLTLTCAALLCGHSAMADRLNYTDGHMDLKVTYIDDEWRIFGNFSGATIGGVSYSSVQMDLDDYQIYLPESALQILPPGYSSLLNVTGDNLWILPQVQDFALPWPGFADDDASIAGNGFGNITYALTGFSGPGDMVMWTTGSFGGVDLKWNAHSDGSINFSDFISSHTHTHFNWGFTAPGTYYLDVTVSGTSTNPGIGFQTGTETLVFHVVPEPSTLALGALVLVAGGAMQWRRRRGGKPGLS